MNEILHTALRYSHITCGFVGLLVFWVPVFAKKGSSWHVRCGWLFAAIALWVGGTGIISSAWACIDPVSFAGPYLDRMTGLPVETQLEEIRFFFSILGYLSLAVLVGIVFGLQVVRLRSDHARLRNPLLVGSQLLLAAAALALVGFGAAHLAGGSGQSYIVPLVLGLVGLFSATNDLRYIFRPRPSRMAWWYKHMENMLGSGIAFYTAFLVFGVSRLVSFEIQGPWKLLPWIAPALIGLPAISLWTRYYRRKFGELDSASLASVRAPAESIAVTESV